MSTPLTTGKGNRRWFQKKRYLIPAGALTGLTALGMILPSEAEPADPPAAVVETVPADTFPVPDVIGLVRAEAIDTIETADLEYSATSAGSTVVRTEPAVGEEVKAGDTVKLFLEDTPEEQAAAAAAQAEADRVAAEQAAAAQAEADRVAAEQAAAAQAETDRVAAEQAAAAEAARKAAAAPPAPSYANCDAVRAAGKAPIRQGQPGFQSKFDRDGDGIGCDS